MSAGHKEDVEAVARACFAAFHARQRDKLEALFAADFRFTSPYDDAIDRAAYFARCWPNGDRFRDFAVERVAAHDDGAYVTYLVTTKDAYSFRNTEYLVVRQGLIKSVEVYFGASYHGGSFVAKKQERGDV